MKQRMLTPTRVSFSLNQHYLNWPQIPVSAMELYIFSLFSWLIIQLLGIYISFYYTSVITIHSTTNNSLSISIILKIFTDTLRVDPTEGL